MRCIFVIAALIGVAAEPKFTAKVEKAPPPEKVAEAIRKLLDERALVVASGDVVVMRIWFRAEIPVNATAEQIANGLTYREIPEGTLMGVLEFPQKFTDFRKQELPAGIYTLRFAIQPDIGDHTGTAPHSEFCLISSADDDRAAGEIEKKRLIEISSRVNEGRHPAVLLLWPNNDREDAVRIVDKGDGVLVVTIKRPVACDSMKTRLGFALTVAGVRKE